MNQQATQSNWQMEHKIVPRSEADIAVIPFQALTDIETFRQRIDSLANIERGAHYMDHILGSQKMEIAQIKAQADKEHTGGLGTPSTESIKPIATPEGYLLVFKFYEERVKEQIQERIKQILPPALFECIFWYTKKEERPAGSYPPPPPKGGVSGIVSKPPPKDDESGHPSQPPERPPSNPPPAE